MLRSMSDRIPARRRASASAAWGLLLAVGLGALAWGGCRAAGEIPRGDPVGSELASGEARALAARIRAAAERHQAAVARRPAGRPGQPGAAPLISNVWVDTDLKQVLADIAAQAKVPIVMDPQLQGVVTLTLERVPVATALERVTLPLGLIATPFGEGWLVGPADAKSPVYPLLVSTVAHRPQHRRAEELRGLLPDWAGSYVKVDSKQNVLLITAPAVVTDRLTKLLTELDAQPKQIVIEAIVVDLSRQALDELGISWSGRAPGADAAGLVSGGAAAVKALTGVAGADVAGAALTWAGPLGSFQLVSKLKALETHSQAKVIAAPRILALEGEHASIFIGTEQYFSFQSGPLNFPFITVEKVPAGVELDLTVQMATPEALLLDVQKAEASTAVPTADNRPLVNRRKAATRVRLPNGGTIAIGGLRQRGDAQSYEGIPLLARIPGLGWLAGSRRWKTDENELVIFVSAAIAPTAEVGLAAG